MNWQRIGSVKSVGEFREHLAKLGLELPCDDVPLSAAEGSPLAQPLPLGRRSVANRWCVHPMEGWDGTANGFPSEHTIRRWRHFGESGCSLIWGGEAVAVRHDGRANPNQLTLTTETAPAIGHLRETLIRAHRESCGNDAVDHLSIGLQLTHSGRFCRPNRKDRLEPRIVYHHPLLDPKFGIDPHSDETLLTDAEIRRLIDDYVLAARRASELGFDFVDVKCCHGYLGHEFLSAFERSGPYGGDFAGRTRFLREIIAGIRAEVPGLDIGVRLSIFDFVPYRPDPDQSEGTRLGPGIPEQAAELIQRGAYPVFGCRRDDPATIDLTEPIALLKQLRDEHGVRLFNLTAGSPYYNPHIQRPAYYPPSDGYQPPEDPLIGCVRQIITGRDLKAAVPDVVLVGTAYTYFQEFLPHVAQAVVRENWIDSVGIGRLVLSDWTLPAKVLRGEDYRAARKICRTFSDCTTAPRNGVVSGCYPLDDHYKQLPEAAAVKDAKAAIRGR
ncbi:MAG: NADH:flavin oxidoreductase [Planctomycetaceae bacterium]|nr:NADH:flavin oxidoreductase [Planctomycetaceae bacterium]